MQEHDIRHLIEQVRTGALPRRRFIQRLAEAGLAAPMAAMLLTHAGIARAQAPLPYKPTRRGGGGTLRLLYWQGPTQLNPHFATGTKDLAGARVFYESLAGIDGDGELVPQLAVEIPTRANGGLAADGRSVTWKLKRDVRWHDGRPFTADDVVFTARYAADPATAAVSSAIYNDIGVEKLDAHTVRVRFKEPTPFWYEAFTGGFGEILPQHRFAEYIGARSRDNPANFAPVGTGPYRFVDFKPGDSLRAEANPDYHVPHRPHFDAIEIKGGGDAASAARAVLQTGEYDFAWNTQVEDEILRRLERGGKGRVLIVPGGAVEYMTLQVADPWTEVDGERASVKSRHPAFRDKAVRDAMGLLVDRQGIENFIYGRTGVATPNILANPPRYRSPNLRAEFDVGKANRLLDAAGWKKGPDGIRAKGGTRLSFVFQTSVNSARQKTQAVIKHACAQAGIALELKSVTSAVFFGGDAGNPDTLQKFWADLQLYTYTMTTPDPQNYMERFCSWEVAQKANKWAGRNELRWRNDDYDRAFEAAKGEVDPVKRAALFIRMNDIVCRDGHVVPLVFRPNVNAAARGLEVHSSGWDNALWALAHWYREG